MSFYAKYGKRAFDLALASCATIVLSPLILGVSVWLHFANKGAGAFFTQERPGKDGKIFRLVKFKSMTDERDADGRLLPDEKRITLVGKFIRSTSIDELPQLINILRGDISIVGPRPLLIQYLPLYSREQARRHDVLPGVTGWAQVHGRNLQKLSKKFEYDVWYVDHLSFTLDLKILFLTAVKVLKRSDVGNGNGTMDEVDDLGWKKKLERNKK